MNAPAWAGTAPWCRGPSKACYSATTEPLLPHSIACSLACIRRWSSCSGPGAPSTRGCRWAGLCPCLLRRMWVEHAQLLGGVAQILVGAAMVRAAAVGLVLVRHDQQAAQGVLIHALQHHPTSPVTQAGRVGVQALAGRVAEGGGRSKGDARHTHEGCQDNLWGGTPLAASCCCCCSWHSTRSLHAGVGVGGGAVMQHSDTHKGTCACAEVCSLHAALLFVTCWLHSR